MHYLNKITVNGLKIKFNMPLDNEMDITIITGVDDLVLNKIAKAINKRVKDSNYEMTKVVLFPEHTMGLRQQMEYITWLHENKSQNLQIIIITQSIYIIGDMPSHNVMLLKEDNGILGIDYVDFQTYGASFSLILSKCFCLHYGVSARPTIEIKELLKTKDIDKINKNIYNFGQSILLRDLYNVIYKSELEQNKVNNKVV